MVWYPNGTSSYLGMFGNAALAVNYQAALPEAAFKYDNCSKAQIELWSLQKPRDPVAYALAWHAN